jgi:alpha-galactosidase
MLKTHLVFLYVTFASMAVLTAGAATKWSLETGDTEIRFGLVDGQPVVQSLKSKKERHNWLAAPAPLSLMEHVWVGGKEFPLTWRLQQVQASAPGQLTFWLTNAEPKLALRSIWRAQPGPGPVEHWAEIENQSGQEITLSCQGSLSLPGLRADGPATAHWIKRGGGNANTEGGTFQDSITNGYVLTLESNPLDGASPVPWLAVQVGAKRGLYVGWEFSGLGSIRARENRGQLEIQVGNHPDFKTDIQSGEVFQVPPAFVGCYQGDVDEGSYDLHRFILDKLRPPMPKNCPDPILAYNLYLDAGGNKAREADVLRCAATCHDLGFEVFMPDAMWFPQPGDWRWDPTRFPRGIKPIEEFVHDAGMRLALWCAWGNGGLSEDPGALNVRRDPDWFHKDYGPDWRPDDFVGAHLCLGCEPAKQWAIEKTGSLVANFKLDYLKNDCDPIMIDCTKTDHRHHYGVDVSYWATMGYYEVQENLLRSFPNLILENCSGAGHIKDFGMVRRSHYTVTTDTLSNLPDRRSIYDSTFAMPPLLLQAYTYDNYFPVRGDNPGTFLWRSAMMGAWQIDPTDTAKWTEAEKKSVLRSVRVYKEWIRPMLQDVVVHHILPRPDGQHWDGLFYWSPSLTKGTVYVFRPDSSEDQHMVLLKGLKPHRKYRVWCEDGSIQPGLHTGDELMETGLTVRLPERYTSDLIFLQDASLGKLGYF